ncbi:hypothetical protein [Tropicibacter sp. Alg240-R139]|uniref:hypothetical protein n=1 Tax=Tropicibacter sp. Alg240-R139 TaxID=2305991 RepID=UPI0013DF8077|nr:hypothetical protein [Tropicibacter sp. Alg240-R139]
MFIENRLKGQEGPSVIGRVYLSKSGKTPFYNGVKFRSFNQERTGCRVNRSPQAGQAPRAARRLAQSR